MSREYSRGDNQNVDGEYRDAIAEIDDREKVHLKINFYPENISPGFIGHSFEMGYVRHIQIRVNCEDGLMSKAVKTIIGW